MGTVGVSVTATYIGTKAEVFSDRARGVKQLREDLLALKLPQPKAENVKFLQLPKGGVDCYFTWPEVARNGTLHRHVKRRVATEDRAQLDAFKELLPPLSIACISYRELNRNSSHYQKRNAANTFTDQSSESSGPTWNYSPVAPDDNAPVWASGSSVKRKASNHFSEAQRLIDGVASTLRMPKQEPVEVTIPPDRIREDSVASSAPSLHAPSPRKIKASPDDEIHHPPSPTPPSRQNRQNNQHPPSTPSEPLVMPPPVHTASASSSPPPGLLFSRKDEQPPPPLPQPPRSVQNINGNAPELLPISQVQPQPQPQPHPQPSQNLPRTQPSLKRSRSPSPSGQNPHPLQRRPPPDPSDLPQIQKLTRELWDVRRQLMANIARESAIISELESLNSAFVPRASAQLRTNGRNGNGVVEEGDTVTKTRLQIVERELQEERALRTRTEGMLRDIQRECREPFVVPALFEAFLMISNVTTQAMNKDA